MSDEEDVLPIPTIPSSLKFSEQKRRWREWILLDGNRFIIAVAVGVTVFIPIAGIEYVLETPFQNTQPLYYIFSSIITGNITLITVVVSINQLLLSRGFETPGELQSQLQSIIEYRSEVEEAADQIAPVQPLGFLRLLFENTRDKAQLIGDDADEHSKSVANDIDELVTELTDHIDEIQEHLDQPEMNTFNVLSTTLTTNYARQINHARQIRSHYEGRLSETTTDALDQLIDRLQEIDIARQYFKTIYLQEELSSVSRLLLYAGLPAETVAIVFLVVLTSTPAVTGSVLYSLAFPLAVTVGIMPLALLFSYIIRIATVIQRTAATIPFTTSRQEK
ncbi:hypothetical protein [Halocatena salina]|uniref:Uncharacterized protein n=1 Tax=Halocatena salina TaxID=2934340 RepID=A0A8U0A9J6_9EURY|nr:hypothetical protein [Halocatena salina]UPM45138.1 hypothetical protein MW046_17420 [Halocatena salina]